MYVQDYMSDQRKSGASVLDLHLIHVLELSRSGEFLETPHRLRHLVRLRLTSTTTMRMVMGIHGHTSDLWSETSVATSSGLTPGNDQVFSVGHRT